MPKIRVTSPLPYPGTPIKSLFQNIGLAVVLNLGIKTAWVLANNIVQDRIGHTDFGLYLALYSLGFLFLALSDMGVNQYTAKTLAHQPQLLRQLFPNLLSLKLFFAFVYPFFMLGVGAVLGYSGLELWYLFLLCSVHSVLQINFFFRSNFQAFQKFRLDAFASVLDRVIMLGIVVVLLLTHISVESYIYAYLASAVATMVVLYVFLVRLFGVIRPQWQTARMRNLLAKSFPFAVITVLYSINDKVDQVMLERIIGGEAGKHETGLYGGAYRWVDTTMMYLWTVLPIFFAKFAKHLTDDRALSRLLAFGQPIATLPMLFVGVFAMFYGDKLLFLFTNSTPAELATMESCLRILFLAVLINGYFAIYSTLLTSTGHERFVSWMIFVSILLNVTLNFIFIPQFGARASAWTTVTSFGFLSLSYLYYIQFRLPVRIPFRNLGKLLLVSLAFTAAFWGLSWTNLPWYAVTALAGGVLLALTYFSGMIKLRDEIE
ncbi:MAG: polysaccharide biosynthesis C-terminal domain-containing protein [Bacteroidota bacterium]